MIDGMKYTNGFMGSALHALLCASALIATTSSAFEPTLAQEGVGRTSGGGRAAQQTEGQSYQDEVRGLINSRFVDRRPPQDSEARKTTKRPTSGRTRRPSTAGQPASRQRPKVTPVYTPAPYSAAASETQPKPSLGGGSAGARRPAVTKGLVEKLIGVTVWRLRAPAQGDETRMLVHDEAGVLREEWTPVRAEAEAAVTAGERVRITVESPEAGYLYVVNRERYADGSAGEPLLIFPTLRTRGGDNRVEAGRLIEVPAQKDGPPYFRMEPSRADQVAEELVIIVTDSPLDFDIGRYPLRLAAVQLREWESRWLAKVTRLEQAGGGGTAWTESERAAGGDETRKLTQEEPLPQTIYHVKTKAGNPLMIKVPLTYRAPGGRD